MIYFILNSKNNTVKIGKTDNLQKRLSQLQTGSDSCLVVILTLPGDVEEEKELHLRFSDHRLNGEWFTFSDEIKQYTNKQHFEKDNDKGAIETQDDKNTLLLARLEREEYVRLQRQLVRDKVKREHRKTIIANNLNVIKLETEFEKRFVPYVRTEYIEKDKPFLLEDVITEVNFQPSKHLKEAGNLLVNVLNLKKPKNASIYNGLRRRWWNINELTVKS
jgi:hypothetical protein